MRYTLASPRKAKCPQCNGKGGWNSTSYVIDGRIYRDPEGEWVWCEYCTDGRVQVRFKAHRKVLLRSAA